MPAGDAPTDDAPAGDIPTGEAPTGDAPPGQPLPLALSLDVSAVPANPVGAGQYIIELVRALREREDIELTLITRRSDRGRWEALAPASSVVAAAPDARPLRLVWEQAVLPRLLGRLNVHVHHSPHYTMPERSPVPVVVTVHDLSFFEAPQWHERSKVLVFRRAIRVAARRSTAVVCPSRVTADELRRWCQVDAPVFVAHHGVDSGRFSPQDRAGIDEAVLSRLDDRLGGDRPYLVFVGTLEPRKDVPALVDAFDRVASRHPDALLVLAGGDGWGTAAVDRALSRAVHRDRVVRTGYVPDAAVPALLRSAVAAVYPALYEGFGLPALEAVACGTPLVTTSGTAMEEVAGAAATLVPPGDRTALAAALDSALGATRGVVEDRVPVGADQARIRGAGAEVAGADGADAVAIVADHTWAASAERHVAAYHLAAARASRGRTSEGPGRGERERRAR